MQSTKISSVASDFCSFPTETNSISPDSAIPHQSYVLYEIDWVGICEYMDRAHIPPLYSLCPSSYVSPSCLELDNAPWVLILHHLDHDELGLVTSILAEGRLV